MCGVVGIWLSESKPYVKEFYQTLIDYAKLRGEDGYGLTIIDPSTNTIKYESKSVNKQGIDTVASKIIEYAKVGDIVLFQTRNAPETELYSDKLEEIQPLTINDFTYIHNGSISNEDVERFKDQIKYNIDSEVIGIAYNHYDRDIKKTLEELVGGWTLIGYDYKKKRIIASTSWLSAGHGYLRGVGYVFHSYWEAIRDAFATIKNLKNPEDLKYTRVWEDFYFHELEGFNILEIDIDSGLANQYPYRKKYSHPIWNPDEKKNRTKVLVLASGGIDSTTTAAYIKKYYGDKVDTELLHFDYGQKSNIAERVAVKKITNRLVIPYKVIVLKSILKFNSSMLTNEDIDINTANTGMKTTDAWVPFRNGVMLSIATAYAEELILSNQYEKVLICGGFPNISESGNYPDNSEKFVDAFHEFIKYGTLASDERIKFLNPFEGLTKREELLLLKEIDETLYGLTVSCDDARVLGDENDEDGIILQCGCALGTYEEINDKNLVEVIDGNYNTYPGLPACGSGLLSYWAAIQVGIDPDLRNYYYKGECKDILSKEYLTKEVYKIEDLDIDSIKQKVNKILDEVI